MRSLKFSEFYEGQFVDHQYDQYELYIIKDNQAKAMYIGISRDSIWHRWFGGGPSHMDTDAAGKIYGKSYIGGVIERHLPSSWNWIVELWSKEDCLKACEAEFVGKDIDRIGIELIEPYMIVKFEPLYNVTNAGGRHEDPLITKKLDKIYKDLFG